VQGVAVDSSLDPIGRLFELSLDMLGTASFDGYFTHLNSAWEQTFGWTNSQLLAEPFLSFVHPDYRDETTKRVTMLKELGAPAVVDFENRFRTRAGTYRWIDWTVVANDDEFYIVGKDITERKVADVHRDQVASLMNGIVASMADGLVVTDVEGTLTFINPAGVYLLGYESADDLLGRSPHATFHHSHLDGTLYPVEECPMSKVRVSGQPVYIHEDTFWRRDGSPVPVSYSSAPIDLSDGTGAVVAFRDITALQAERERLRPKFGDIAWFEDVRQAVAKGRLVLYTQPIIEIATGAIVKHELLLRMLSPTGQVIVPGLFLPAAEKYGLIDDIDRWVITQATEIAATGKSVAVNLSAESVGRTEIMLHIERELVRTGADPRCVTFEITETAVMKDLQDGRRFANRLVALGCSFALDDFGTGYGSLTYLRQLPIDYIKIDVQFVLGMVQNEADRRLVQTVVSIAKGLSKQTIAEGVEDEETLSLLRDFGVDFAQGYFFGRPGPLALPQGTRAA
jgi:PAS domain S-box-containing protein